MRSFIVLCCVALCPTAAWSRTITLPLRAGARVQVAQLTDGFTVGVFVRGIDEASLKNQLRALGPERIETLRPAPNQTVAYLHFADRVQKAQASLSKQTRGRAQTMAIALQIETIQGREAVLNHALSGALPLPASLDAQLLKDADHLLLQGHVAQAEMQLEQLKKNYPLHAWVMLRLGDVAIRKQQVDRACELYHEASREGLERTASVMALLRARVMGCPDGAEPPWERLLSRDAIDDPVGQRISDEAAWALSFEKNLASLHTVRALEGPFFARTIDRKMRQAIVARLMRRESPLGVAALAEQKSLLMGHPEAFDLDLSAGRAWCALGSPASYKQRSFQASTWMRLTGPERRKWQEQAAACALGHAQPQAIAQKAQKTLPERHLAQLLGRVAAATREVNRRHPLPAAKKAKLAEADVHGAAGATTTAPQESSTAPNKEKQ